MYIPDCESADNRQYHEEMFYHNIFEVYKRVSFYFHQQQTITALNTTVCFLCITCSSWCICCP